MDDTDLEDALDRFADDLKKLIAYLTSIKDDAGAAQVAGAQATLRSAATRIGAATLVLLFANDEAALATLSGATETLNNNADKIIQQQKNLSVVIGIVNAALHIVGSLNPFNLAKAVQGLVELQGTATV